MSTSRPHSPSLIDGILPAPTDIPDFELATFESTSTATKEVHIIPDLRDQAETIRQQGVLALQKNQLPQAMEFFKQAITLREKIHVLDHLPVDSLFIGDCFQGLGCAAETYSEESILDFLKGAKAYEKLTEEERTQVPQFYNILYEYFYVNLIGIYCHKKFPDDALILLKSFLQGQYAHHQTTDQSKMNRLIAQDYERIADAYRQLKVVDKEADCYLAAIQHLEAIKDVEEEDHYLKNRLWQNYGELQYARTHHIVEAVNAYRQAAPCLEALAFKYESDRFYKVSYAFYMRYAKLLQQMNNNKGVLDCTQLALSAVEKLGKRRIREEWILFALLSLALSELSNDAVPHVERAKKNLKELIHFLTPKYSYLTHGYYFGEQMNEYYAKLMAWYFRLALRTEDEERASYLQRCFMITTLDGSSVSKEQLEQISDLFVEVHEKLQNHRLLRDHFISRGERCELMGDYERALQFFNRAKLAGLKVKDVSNSDIQKQLHIKNTFHHLFTHYKEEYKFNEMQRKNAPAAPLPPPAPVSAPEPAANAEATLQIQKDLKALQEEVKQLRTELAERTAKRKRSEKKSKEEPPAKVNSASFFQVVTPPPPQARRTGLRSGRK